MWKKNTTLHLQILQTFSTTRESIPRPQHSSLPNYQCATKTVKTPIKWIQNEVLTCFLNKSAWAASAWSAAAMKPMTSSTDQSAGGAPGAGGGGAPVVDDAGSGLSGDTRAILPPEHDSKPFTLLPASSSYSWQIWSSSLLMLGQKRSISRGEASLQYQTPKQENSKH